ncbi:MAG: glycosyltransferase family 9 protein [Planctomycetes bacterium]|nr:glycosyltransferase family 9 protein [Planctomycetota bacterium]
MTTILIVKTGALGDVLRTTSILPGLRERYTDCRVTWITAPAAVELVRSNPLVAEVVALDAKSSHAVAELQARLARTTWGRVLSFDDEEPLCRLVSALPTKRLSGAYLESDGRRAYTPDVAPWFDMGLLSVHGKARADRMKVENRKSHPAIFAEMLGIRMGKPTLKLDERARHFGDGFAARYELAAHGRVIGLNTGAGGRWHSKTLSVEKTAALARILNLELGGAVTFVLLGGPGEVERNLAIVSALKDDVRLVDAGCDNPLLDFAAIVSKCDLLVSSDSLALHVAIALDVRSVVFFAPTSAAEIELYGLGEKVVSTAPDYCSYKPDADVSTVTPERVAAAVLRQLPRRA